MPRFEKPSEDNKLKLGIFSHNTIPHAKIFHIIKYRGRDSYTIFTEVAFM